MKFTRVYGCRLIGLSTLTSFLLIAVALAITIQIEPVSKYESSIYNSGFAFPFFLLAMSFCIGVTTVIMNGQTKAGKEKRYYRLGLIVVALGILIIVILPYLKGYFFFSRADGLAHIGYAIDIQLTGHIGQENFYPATHILIVFLAILAGVHTITVCNFLPGFFILFYLISAYILCRHLYKLDRRRTAIGSLSFFIPITLIYPLAVSPNSFAILILPFLIFVYISKVQINKTRYLFLFVIFSFFLIFLHILVAFLFGLILLTYIAYMRFSHENIERKGLGNRLHVSLGPLLILIVLSFIWLYSSALWSGSIGRIAKWIAGQQIASAAEATFDILSKLDLSLLDLISLFIKIYGSLIFFIIIALIGSLYLLKSRKVADKNEMLAVLLFISLAIAAVLILFIIPMGFDHNRALRFLLIPLKLVVGISLYRFWIPNKRFRTTLVVILMVLPAILGWINLYPSDYNMSPNSQVTATEMSGVNWFVQFKDRNESVVGVTSMRNFVEATIGVETTLTRTDIPGIEGNKGYVGDHFSRLHADKSTQNRYMTISDFDIALYTNIWTVSNRFSIQDFENLSSDQNMNLIFNNGGFFIYYISN